MWLWTGSLNTRVSISRSLYGLDINFFSVENLLQTLPSCSGIENNNLAPSVDLTIIIDGSRNEYNSLRLISFLAELAEVSSYASTLSVIHGETGEYLVERTHSVTETFEQLRNFSGPCK
jgi:hypothetical protein